MLHLPSGYEFLQAYTQPTKVEDEPFPVPLLFGNYLSYDDFNEFCPCFWGKGKKNSAKLDPNIWWGSRHTS
jgi:hypothetical protein